MKIISPYTKDIRVLEIFSTMKNERVSRSTYNIYENAPSEINSSKTLKKRIKYQKEVSENEVPSLQKFTLQQWRLNNATKIY